MCVPQDLDCGGSFEIHVARAHDAHLMVLWHSVIEKSIFAGKQYSRGCFCKAVATAANHRNYQNGDSPAALTIGRCN